MGSYLSTQSTQVDGIILDANSAVDQVTQTQGEIQKQLNELETVIKKQETNVNNLKKTQGSVKEHFRKSQKDVYTREVHTQGSCTGSNPGCAHCTENKELKKKITDLESLSAKTKTGFEVQKQRFESENKRLQDDNRAQEQRFESENKRLQDDNRAQKQRFDSEKTRLQDDNRAQKQRFENERQTLQDEKSYLYNEKQQLESQKSYSQRRIQELEAKMRQAEEDMRRAKQKKVCVSLYCGTQSTLMDASVELSRMLCCHWEALGIEASVNQCPDPQARSCSVPLIVLCINASRLGTDVSNATQNIHCDQSVAVVILHHKEIHALPSQPSEKLLVGAHYRQLGAIVDIAFLKVKGMYPCDMNEKALDKLTAFIQNFVQKG